jgi:hypothetical protein
MAHSGNENSLANLKKPWKKGKSGNPNGRPKGTPNSSAIISKFINNPSNEINPVTQEYFTYHELMWLEQIRRAGLGDLDALKAITDRLEGGTQKGPFEEENGIKQRIAQLSDDQLNDLLGNK